MKIMDAEEKTEVQRSAEWLWEFLVEFGGYMLIALAVMWVLSFIVEIEPTIWGAQASALVVLIIRRLGKFS